MEEWCDEILPEIYNSGLYDSEEITDDVWEHVTKEAAAYAEAVFDDTDEQKFLIESILDAAGDWFRNHHDTLINTLEPLETNAVTAILQAPQTSQHSTDWYMQRRNRLTASEFSHILTGSRERLLKSKLETGPQESYTSLPVALAQPDGDMVATSWGHRFESIVRNLYELELAGVGTVCDSLGRFTHREYTWLSASPDGIVTRGPLAGRLLEIKAPKTRQPDTYVPSE